VRTSHETAGRPWAQILAVNSVFDAKEDVTGAIEAGPAGMRDDLAWREVIEFPEIGIEPVPCGFRIAEHFRGISFQFAHLLVELSVPQWLPHASSILQTCLCSAAAGTAPGSAGSIWRAIRQIGTSNIANYQRAR